MNRPGHEPPAVDAASDADWKRHILRTFIPFNALDEDHLNTLLRDTHLEVVCAGQELFRAAQRDNQSVYLLSGEVELAGGGSSRRLGAADPECHLPLAQDQPRRFSARALSDCQLIRFDSDRLDAMVAWSQAADYITLDISSRRECDEDMDWMLTLLRSNLFYKVPPMNIREVLHRFEPVYGNAGEVILRQGELGDSCYFIKEGSVDVFQAPDAKSPPAHVAVLGVGRFFGEDALLNETARNATISMRENGVLMRLLKRDFFLLLKSPLIRTVTLNEMRTLVDEGAPVIDVRSQDEFESGHWPGARNMPLSILQLKARLLDSAEPCVLYCNSGRRSGAATHLLASAGFSVCCLRGGVESLAPADRAAFTASESAAG